MSIYKNGNKRGYVVIAHIRYWPNLYAKRDGTSNTRGYVGTAHDDTAELRHAYRAYNLVLAPKYYNYIHLLAPASDVNLVSIRKFSINDADPWRITTLRARTVKFGCTFGCQL